MNFHPSLRVITASGHQDRIDRDADMIRALAAATIAAFIAAAVTVLPSFAPPVAADIPQALAKADRLPIPATGHSCATQNWPNIDASCLRRTNSRSGIKSGIQPARRVTTDRV